MPLDSNYYQAAGLINILLRLQTMKYVIYPLVSLILVGCSSPSKSAMWARAEGEDEGKPVSIRYRQEIPIGVDTRKYPHLIIISWVYEAANESGMPSLDLFEEMVQVEDALVKSLETHRIGFLTATFLGNHTREWQIYARSRHEAQEQINKALEGFRQLPISITSESDPEWQAYLNFVQ